MTLQNATIDDLQRSGEEMLAASLSFSHQGRQGGTSSLAEAAQPQL